MSVYSENCHLSLNHPSEAGGVRMTTAMDFGWVFFKMAKKLTRIVELLPSMYYDMTGKYFYFQWFCITRLLK